MVEYSNILHGYLEIPNHAHLREILDVYTIIFDGMIRLPMGFDYQRAVRILCKISHNKLQAVRTTSVRCLDKILVLVEKDTQDCKDKVKCSH